MIKRNILISIFMLLTIGLLVACGSSKEVGTVPEVTQTQFLTPPDDIRDYRYCEIIPVFRDGLTLRVEIYNTYTLNECPADLWKEMDAEAMAEAYGATAVKINGPRYWVMNELVGGGESVISKVVDFGGIEMSRPGVLETKLWEGTVGDEFYTDNGVQRSTSFTYYADNMVYELTSPNGDVYRMQSYSQIVDSTLTIADLETLGERLELPDGWSYQATVLTEDSELIADGLAYVINDELLNSYQRVTP